MKVQDMGIPIRVCLLGRRQKFLADETSHLPYNYNGSTSVVYVKRFSKNPLTGGMVVNIAQLFIYCIVDIHVYMYKYTHE